MTSVVIDLQKKALDKTASTSDLLREALVIARKLKILPIQDWLKSELNGYSENSIIPDYRIIVGEIKSFNHLNGIWMPCFFSEGFSAVEEMKKGYFYQSVGELESLILGKENSTIVLRFPDKIVITLMRDFKEIWTPPTLHIPKLSVFRILEIVRNKVLEWTLDLEEQGILGEDFIFSEQEKKNSANVVFNILNMANSQISTNNFHSQMQNETKNSQQAINQSIILSENDWKTFYEDFINPPEPNKYLKKIFKEYQEIKNKDASAL